MYDFSPLMFPIVGNLIAIFLILKSEYRIVKTMLVANLITSIGFGLSIAIKVFCCSNEPSLWPMPLVFATIEYWLKFGLMIAIISLLLIIKKKRQDRKKVN